MPGDYKIIEYLILLRGHIIFTGVLNDIYEFAKNLETITIIMQNIFFCPVLKIYLQNNKKFYQSLD